MQSEYISIIVLNHNGLQYLDKCLKTVTQQSYPSYEVILVDNASTDDSVAFVKKHFPQVKITQNKIGLGFAGGNNVGIRKAKGEHILLLSNDTWIKKDFLSKIIDFYTNNSFDVIAPREAKYDETLIGSYLTTIDPLGHNVFMRNGVSNNKQPFYLTGVCLFFNKKFYEDTGGMDEDFFLYCEDVDWFWRLQLFKKTFSYIDNLFVYHAGAGSSGGMEKPQIKYGLFLLRNKNTLQMLLKNYSLLSLLWVLSLYILQNIFEILFFLLILKPKIAFSYLEGWWFNIKMLPKTLEKRKWIQEKRMVSDLEILKHMYIGFAKLFHLVTFMKDK